MDFWVGKICWRRPRLPTPVFLGFLGSSAGKESACNVGDLGLIPGLGRCSGEGRGYPLHSSGLEDSMDCMIPWGHKESNMTEQLSLSLTKAQILHRFHPFSVPGSSPVSILRLIVLSPLSPPICDSFSVFLCLSQMTLLKSPGWAFGGCASV